MDIDERLFAVFQRAKKQRKLPEKFAGKSNEELRQILEDSKKRMIEILEDPTKDVKDLTAFLAECHDDLDLENYFKGL